MSELILHIGVWKTATTSIQEVLFNARNDLSNDGIYYSDFEPNCRFIFGSYSNGKPNHVVFHSNQHTYSQVKEKYQNQLESFIDASKNSRLTIISSEYALDLQEEEIAKLKADLDQVYDHITVIAYLRNPIGHVTSALNEQVKQGHYSLETAYSIHSTPKEIAKLKLWDSIFGSENMILRSFDIAVKGDGVLSDFMCVSGITNEIKNHESLVSNESLSFEALELSSLLFEKGFKYPRDKEMLSFLQQIPGVKFQPKNSFVKSVYNSLENDIRWLAQEKKIQFSISDSEESEDCWSLSLVCSVIALLSSINLGLLFRLRSVVLKIGEEIELRQYKLPQYFRELYFTQLRDIAQRLLDLSEYKESKFFAEKSLTIFSGRKWPEDILKKIEVAEL